MAFYWNFPARRAGKEGGLMIALDCNMRQPNQGIAPGRVREDLQRGNGFVSFFFGTLLRPFQRTAGRHRFQHSIQ